MNIQFLLKKLNKNGLDLNFVEKSIVKAFVVKNRIDIKQSTVLEDYLGNEELQRTYQVFADEIMKTSDTIQFDDLIEAFECLIPSVTKKKQGAVYTPSAIRSYMVLKCLENSEQGVFLDPACGCGAFLVSVAKSLHDIYNLSYDEAINNYIYGVDVDPAAIEKTKVLLSLLALSNGCYNALVFNLFCDDFLNPKTVEHIKKSCVHGIDYVIGNPPYVRFRNMADNAKQYFNKWETAQNGNIDLYMPFFESGSKVLKDNGKIIYITPNGFMQAVNGRSLRKYFENSKWNIKLLDFRDNQVFKGVTSYTCITMIDKSCAQGKILYKRVSSEKELVDTGFQKYDITSFPDGSAWRMSDKKTDKIIYSLEHSGKPLREWTIRNGLATLKNDLYFFTPSAEDEKFYYRCYGGKKYKIEKSICIKVIKPNIIRNEDDLITRMEIAIFPYLNKNGRLEIIPENELKSRFKYTYQFLLDNKSTLENRDKGKGKYPEWYAYGRTQGMNNFGKKLLIPYIAGEPIAVVSLEPNVLFYCGYALFSEDETELRVMKRFLQSDAFWYYIFHTSKPYSKGFMAFAKNYIVRFTVPALTEDDIKYILSEKSSTLLNEYIWGKYGLKPQKI